METRHHTVRLIGSIYKVLGVIVAIVTADAVRLHAKDVDDEVACVSESMIRMRGAI